MEFWEMHNEQWLVHVLSERDPWSFVFVSKSEPDFGKAGPGAEVPSPAVYNLSEN